MKFKAYDTNPEITEMKSQFNDCVANLGSSEPQNSEDSVKNASERARWWWGTAPSEITGESTEQYSRQTPVFFGGEMLENIRVDS